MNLSYQFPDAMQLLSMLLSLIELLGPWVFLALLVIAVLQQWVIHTQAKALEQEHKTSEYYYQEYRKLRGSQHIYHEHDLIVPTDLDNL